MPAFIDHAVRALASVVSSGISAQLRRVEAEEGLPADSLGAPCEVIRAAVPFTYKGTTGAPMIAVYDEQGAPSSQRHDLIAVDCSVEMIWTSGVDLQAAEDFGRRWQTAIFRTIVETPSPEEGIAAIIVGDFDRITEEYDSATRHARRIGVEVRVHSPR